MLYMFDVDGTLIEGFLRNWKKEGMPQLAHPINDIEADLYDAVELLPGRKERLERIATEQTDPRFAIITNQAGVAFGYQTEDQVRAKMAKVVAELNFFWNRAFSVHISFEHPKPAPGYEQYRCLPCRYRKPAPGMLFEAMASHFNGEREAAAVLTKCVYIGDLDSDKNAALAANIRYIEAERFFA